jgi:hypothetical protein
MISLKIGQLAVVLAKIWAGNGVIGCDSMVQMGLATHQIVVNTIYIVSRIPVDS